MNNDSPLTPPPPTTTTAVTASQPQQQQPASVVVNTTASGVESLPWFLRVFSSPALLANVIAFGAALLLLYTAAVEWPRQTERFYERLQEQRDATREAAAAQKDNQRLIAENQRLLTKIESLEERQMVAIESLKKVLTEMWFKLLSLEGKVKGKEEEEGPPPPGPGDV